MLKDYGDIAGAGACDAAAPCHTAPTANPPMKTPTRLQSLQDEGLIDSVQRQLMSGKEALVFVVRCGDET